MSIEIKVLGTGCPKCKKLYAEAEKAISMAGKDVTLSKVDDITEIMEYGIMMTPGLVINGQIKASGKIPNAKQIAGWIEEVAASTE